MKKRTIYIVLGFILFCSVPWFFTETNPNKFFGLPLWGFYSLMMTIFFAVITSLLIGKYWNVMAGEEEDE